MEKTRTDREDGRTSDDGLELDTFLDNTPSDELESDGSSDSEK